MRFQLTLNACKTGSKIPLNYQYAFSSWIYNTLNAGNTSFAEFLHNQGYVDQKKRFRLFCFSNLRMAKYLQEGDRLELLENPQRITISFYPLEAMEPFVVGLFQNQSFSIGDKTSKAEFVVSSIEKLPEPEFTDQMAYKLASPVHIARRNPFNSSKIDHLHPEHIDFAPMLIENLISKYKAYHGQKSTEASGYMFEILTEPRSKAIHIKQGNTGESILKSYLFSFRLKADKELQRMGYYAGFGKENSQGFGFADIMKEGLVK
jgi:CRISPR-associated endoribonuclease Cas6